MLFTTGGAPLEVIKKYIEQQGQQNGAFPTHTPYWVGNAPF